MAVCPVLGSGSAICVVATSKLVPSRPFVIALGVVVALFLGNCRAFAQSSVVTQHNDNSRTGQNTSETILTTANVTVSTFGKLFSVGVDGQVYAQPLYVPGVTINGATHNVLIVATENDSVYAFDADSNAGANASPLWKISLIDSAHGAGANETPASSATINCTDLQPQIGVTSTPVIDIAAGAIYVEAKSTNGTGYFHRLHALSLTTGAEKSQGPVVVTATVSGTGDGSSSGTLTFNPMSQMNRPGLLLLNGVIYLAYASHCDDAPYHGWLFGYNESTFAQTSVFVTTPNGGLGGFWMSGAGIAADANSYIYIPSGNGTFDTTDVPATELGDSILKLSTTNGVLSLLDYFTPFDQANMAANDYDFGSGGTLLLPDQTGTYPHIMVQAGKEGTIYVVNRDQLTTGNSHYCSSCASDTEIIEETASGAIGGMFALPAYWNNTLYFWGAGDYLRSIPLANGLPNFSSMTANSTSLSWPGATPSISSNGATAGTAILWAIDSSQFSSSGPAILHAFNATSIATELWNSTQAASSRDQAGAAVKFAVPTVVNGKVYVGTSTEVDVYGLLPVTATPTITPAAGSYTNSVTVSITDSASGAPIYYTTNNTTPTTSSTVYSGPFTLTSSATVQAIAVANGYAPSAAATVAYAVTVPPVAATPSISPAAGSFTTAVSVSITDSTANATIYYTTNNTAPTTSSTKYTGAFSLTSSATVQAMAVASGYTQSAVATTAYTINIPPPVAATPTISPAAGSDTGSVAVTITDVTSGATIYYTTNGTTPTTSSTQYTGAFTLTSSASVEAIAVASGYTQSATATAAYTITPASSSSAISIKFVGKGTAMAATESAGVVPETNWNQASGNASSAALALLNSSGSSSGATVTWKADNTWALPVTDQAGNYRMMRGYLDTAFGDTTVVTVSGLPAAANGYTVYVYADADNGSTTKNATYQITGTGVTTTSIGLIVEPNSTFSGTFTQANNSAGNYAVFTVNAGVNSFTISAIPGTASDGNPRAPLNAIEIVPVTSAGSSQTAPDFSLSANPSSSSVTQGSSAKFTISAAALNGFTGSVALTASGLPSGATAAFSPTSITPGSTSTLTVTTAATTPVATSTISVTGASGALSHTASVTLNVTSAPTVNPMSIKFVGGGSAMAPSESAGVVAETNWNQASGAASSSGLVLVDSTGASTGAKVTWTADNLWMLPIADQPGNYRMMRGYLDTAFGDTTVVTVSGLPAAANGYTVYVYADADNGSTTKNATYQITGTDITTTSIGLIVKPNSTFSGTFTQANNSAGNYVVFTINTGVTSFTISAIPGTASDNNPRAPVNAIQIVPR